MPGPAPYTQYSRNRFSVLWGFGAGDWTRVVWQSAQVVEGVEGHHIEDVRKWGGVAVRACEVMGGGVLVYGVGRVV